MAPAFFVPDWLEKEGSETFVHPTSFETKET